MSNAVVHRRNGKPVKEVANRIEETISIDRAVKDDPAVTVAAILASTAPTIAVMDRAALLRAYEESFDRSVKSIGGILDNTALSVYCIVDPKYWTTRPRGIC